MAQDFAGQYYAVQDFAAQYFAAECFPAKYFHGPQIKRGRVVWRPHARQSELNFTACIPRPGVQTSIHVRFRLRFRRSR